MRNTYKPQFNEEHHKNFGFLNKHEFQFKIIYNCVMRAFGSRSMVNSKYSRGRIQKVKAEISKKKQCFIENSLFGVEIVQLFFYSRSNLQLTEIV